MVRLFESMASRTSTRFSASAPSNTASRKARRSRGSVGGSELASVDEKACSQEEQPQGQERIEESAGHGRPLARHGRSVGAVSSQACTLFENLVEQRSQPDAGTGDAVGNKRQVGSFVVTAERVASAKCLVRTGDQVGATADLEAFVGPVFDATLEPVRRFGLVGQIFQPAHQFGFVAKALVEQAGIPDLVQVGVVVPAVAELKVVASAIVSVGDVHWLMKILDQMDVESQAPFAAVAREALAIEQDRAKFGDLRDHAAAAPAIAGIVMLGGDRHVDEMPAGAAGNLAAVFVGPGRGVRQRFARVPASRE